MENPKDWLEVAKDIVNQALGVGFVTFVITLLLYLAFSFEYIKETALSGYAYEVVQILLVISAGLFLVGILISVGKILRALIKIPVSHYSEKREHRSLKQKLLQNLNMLHASDRLFLLVFSQHPDGRFISPGYDGPVENLLRSGFIESEEAGSFYVGQIGQHMRLKPVVLEPDVREALTTIVESEYPGASSNQDKLVQAIEAEARRRKQASGSWMSI